MADPGHSYSGTSHKLNVWALKWAERQETTRSRHTAKVPEWHLYSVYKHLILAESFAKEVQG
jgi:hypothetical protein